MAVDIKINKIRDALIAAFSQIKDSVKLKEVQFALETTGIQGAVEILEGLQIEGIIDQHIIDDINTVILTGGQAMIESLPASATIAAIPFRYDMLYALTADRIRAYQTQLIQQISNNTRQAIMESLKADFMAGVNPKVTARNFKNTIGLTVQQERAVRNFERGLRELNPRVLERALRDKRYDRTILNAIMNKKPLTEVQIEQMVSRYRTRYVAYRAEVIARTESLRAISIGQYTSMVQAANEGYIDRERMRRFWVHTRGPRTRPTHRLIDGMNPEGVAIDEPFITPLGPLLYPRDPNGSAANTVQCRCRVRYKMLSLEEIYG